MTIIWREQSEFDIPPQDDWLNPGERARISRMRFAKRRSDWRLGRWTAKCAVATYMHLPIDPRIFQDLEIRSSPSGAPEVFRENRPVDVTISLSHRDGRGVCAAAPRWVLLGCDLERVEPHSPVFVADYFTGPERGMVAAAPLTLRNRLPALLWSAKESLLKAFGLGLRLDTRALNVSPDSAFNLSCVCWQPLQVYTRDSVYHGWWCERDQFVRTLVAHPAPPVPAASLNSSAPGDA